jgi:hypothetical protein
MLIQLNEHGVTIAPGRTVEEHATYRWWAMSRTSSPDVAGVVVTVEPAYPREASIGWHILLPILVTAAVTRLLALAIAAILRDGKSGSGGRSLKELRRGPEFLVTEFTVQADDGTLVELEIHGHLAKSALLPRDRIRARVRPQRRRDLPPRAYRIDNYTSGRAHGPHAPTRLGHIGPPLLLNAFVGFGIIVLVATSLMV